MTNYNGNSNGGDYLTSSSQLKQPILTPSLQCSNLEVGCVYTFTPKPGLSRLVLLQKPVLKTSVVVAVVPRRAVLVVIRSDGNWRLIYCCGFEGWINAAVSGGKLTAFERTEKIARYQDWKGNNHVMCGGKVVLGSDRGYFVLTNLLIIIPSVLYFVYVNDKLSQSTPFAVSPADSI